MKKLIAILFVACATFAAPQPKDDPAAFVRDLYKAHNAGKGPFFQNEDKPLIGRWFDRRLTELIWRDAVEADGEVGRIEADPLYDSQDTDGIKNVRMSVPERTSASARVLVTYDQGRDRYTIDFRLTRLQKGWRITNIYYPDSETDLVSMLE
ncbi:MAG TPA: hypothetical protein VEK11_19320 [Thermoanaerobaculia bacterium]|nr:hypothetical protein [Thermoanaerobaculia bacterium]